MNPYVKSVKPQEDYCLLLTFENGEKRVFDLKPYLEQPVFKPLRSMTLFKTARIVSGSVEWQGEVDLSYDTLYLEGKPVQRAQPQRKTTRGRRRDLAAAAGTDKKTPKPRATAKS